MGWPKGVPRKKVDVQQTTTGNGQNTTSVVKFVTPLPSINNFFHYDGIFGIRFLRKNDRFAGLWELVKLKSDMTREKIVTDANTKGQVIVLLSREIKKIVAGA